MKNDEIEKIINDLEVINNNLKSEGIKIIMAQNRIKPHIHNEEMMNKILNSIKDNKLYNLVLIALEMLKKV
ncbi:hypothetical protein [Methanocaldococcus fervens]|uniref:Uncharacterized protein n=1 Tax=Methanocaldococcus fervens (strain DSM 4213 / JCM 15782 / AG86) TaxID=573064 RepID=C7P9H7_METFA|nr:hypothetical protein [Methanocaldococcus fervens]ACV25209.1 hypothetical protein Mefer_1402 [Methanocaldococcus fervens AG86]